MFSVSEHLQALLKKCSTKPGIYKMLDKENQIIYVGKAKNLRKRVKSYFQKNKTITPKVAVMREKIVTIEFTVTRTELEALVLETNLIKSLRPKYNILMKDDKNYVYVKISKDIDFPEIEIVRRFQKDPTHHYFGPYTSTDSIFKTLKGLQKLFPYRSCHGEINEVAPGQTIIHNLSRKAPCLDYYIKRCQAPCIGKITKVEYQANIAHICAILGGEYHDLEKQWEISMKEAVAKKAFEQAAKYRDRLQALSVLLEKQYAILTSGHNQDVIAVAKDGANAVIALFMIRNGHIIRTEHFNLTDQSKEESIENIITSFIQQYYTDASSIPEEIVTSVAMTEERLLAQFLSALKSKKVTLLTPERGEKRQLIGMVEDNAKLQLEANKQAWERERLHTSGALEGLQQAIKLKQLPRRIECYDISHTQGTNKVGSMIVFVDGKPLTSHYRSFTIKDLAEGENNDFASLQEVLTRRIQYLDTVYREKKKRRKEKIDTVSLPERPDLIIIDGGKGQLSSVMTALKAVIKSGSKITIPKVVSLAKQEEEIFVPRQKTPIILPKDSPEFFLVQRIRDEAHRFAIQGHRKMRDKKMVHSVLDNIAGIGPKTKKKLLTTFGSVSGIREASWEELLKIVDEQVAEKIREQI